jgi:hypothetical protein
LKTRCLYFDLLIAFPLYFPFGGCCGTHAFARGAEAGTPEKNRLRDEFRSSGGIHSLLTIFESPKVTYELKVVAAIAVAYLSPSGLEASTDTHASIAMTIVECIRFLTRC